MDEVGEGRYERGGKMPYILREGVKLGRMEDRRMETSYERGLRGCI